MSGLEFIYNDDFICVVNKPSGLLSVPGKGESGRDSVVARCIAQFPQMIEQPAVHRLDMDTSGILLIAKTKLAHRNLSIQFQEGKVSKYYEALLDGNLEEQEGEISLPFRLDVNDRPKQIYDAEHGKLGLTRWKLIRHESGCSRVGFYPQTGRTHQLRVHSAHQKGLGMPIVGDCLYGGHTKHGELKLHAAELVVRHPETGGILKLNSRVPF